MKKPTNTLFVPRQRGGHVQNKPIPGVLSEREATRDRIRQANVDPNVLERAMRHAEDFFSNDLVRDLRDENAASADYEIDEGFFPNGGDDHQSSDDVGTITSDQLPAVIGQAMMATSVNVVPKWHSVKALPGNLLSQVRAFGRIVFSSLTDTPMEEMRFVSNAMNVNDDSEVQCMMMWLMKYGHEIDCGTMNFDQVMPGYEAEIKAFEAEGCSFIAVKDFAGYYIYGFPGQLKLEHNRVGLPGSRM